MPISSMAFTGLNASTSRRRFVTGLAAGGILTGLGIRTASAAAPPLVGNANVLSGSTFDLTIGEAPVNITGSPSVATAVNGSVPAPVLHWREGDTVTLRVTQPPARRPARSIGTACCCPPAWTACPA